MKNTEYTIKDHFHNYAIWTAARAVQRGFTTTANIKAAIDAAGLRDFAENKQNINADEFEDFHMETAHKILSSLEEIGLDFRFYAILNGKITFALQR